MDPTKRCPLCGEVILAIAVRCRYCQGDLSQPVPLDKAAPLPDRAIERVPDRPDRSVRAIDGPRRDGDPLRPTAGDAPPRPPLAMPPLVAPPKTPEEFEQRFLEFAYTTDFVISAPTVAFALRVPIDEATERLEDLAARDVLVREVDARGSVFFQLPGRQQFRQAAQVAVPAVPPAGVTFNPQSAVQSPGAQSTALVPTGAPQAYLAVDAGRELSLTQAPSEGTALAAMLVNTLCMPGLGSIIGGRSSAGIGQLLLFLIGIPLTLIIVGAPMILSAWIWGLITGIDIMNQAKQAQAQQRRELRP